MRLSAHPSVRVLPHADEPTEPSAFPLELGRRASTLLVAGAVVIGFVVRAAFVFSSAYPLNDGGMFYAMVRDVQANGYVLPDFTAYNAGHIPFTYPPLGFYIAAAVDRATPMGLTQTFRVLPLTFSTLTIVAFYLLARDMFRSRAVVATAVLFFAVIPPGFTWMIMGGGLTRALGFVFAILTIRAVRSLYVADNGPRHVLIAGALGALTVLSHLEMAWFACVVAALFFVTYGRTRRALLQSLAVGATAFVFTAPWWAVLVARHGIAPLIAAAHSTGTSWWHPLALLLQFDATGEPMFPILCALALLGAIVLLRRREYALPLWVVGVAALDQRAFLTSGAVAMALLAAVGVHSVILPLVTRPQPVLDVTAAADAPRARIRRSPAWLVPAVMMVVLAYPVLGALASTPSLLHGITPADRAAMQWVSDSTPEGSRFAVVSGRRWPVDADSEWFPALTGRQSIATVQGYEWLPGDAFDRQREIYLALQDCAGLDGACIEDWRTQYGMGFDYVYVSTLPPTSREQDDTECCDALRSALRRDSRYQVVYDGAGATVFRRVP